MKEELYRKKSWHSLREMTKLQRVKSPSSKTKKVWHKPGKCTDCVKGCILIRLAFHRRTCKSINYSGILMFDCVKYCHYILETIFAYLNCCHNSICPYINWFPFYLLPPQRLYNQWRLSVCPTFCWWTA